MRVIAILFQLRQKSLECHFGIADQPVVELGATAKLFSANVDLDNGRVLGKKLLIREIGADHEQSVAVHHRKVTGGKSEQAGHTDIERIVVLDKLLPAQCVDDRCIQFAGERDQLSTRTRTTRPGKDRDLVRFIENFRNRINLVVCRNNRGSRRRKMQARLFDSKQQHADVGVLRQPACNH